MKLKIGYIRVSTEEQNTARQEVLMKELNVEKVFIEKISGKNKDRKKLKEMMEFSREGDIIVVESISRFARNTRDLLELIDTLKKKGVGFISKKESMDTETPAGNFMLTMFGAIAELERAYILDRQKEGIAIAKKEGKFKGRQLKKIDDKLFEELYVKWKNREIMAIEFMAKVGMKANSFYRRVKIYESKKKEDESDGVERRD
jgi:DNA invertase Pin-like site-specific DNA recombinase